MGHAIAHFFANGGAEALVVRVAGAGAADADTDLALGAVLLIDFRIRGDRRLTPHDRLHLVVAFQIGAEELGEDVSGDRAEVGGVVGRRGRHEDTLRNGWRRRAGPYGPAS